MPDFYFILFLKRLDADEKLQYFQLPYIPCRMVSGNEIKLCLKHFCLPIYFIHFEISLTFILPNNSYKPSTNTAWVRARLCKLQKGCTRLAAASDKVYQLFVHGRWFSPGTAASSNTKTGRHDIAEILLKVALNTKIKSNQSSHC